MYTSITLAAYTVFNKLKVLDLSHEAAYKASLIHVLNKKIPYGNHDVKLLKVEHPQKNYTRFQFLADGQYTFNVFINTYYP